MVDRTAGCFFYLLLSDSSLVVFVKKYGIGISICPYRFRGPFEVSLLFSLFYGEESITKCKEVLAKFRKAKKPHWMGRVMYQGKRRVVIGVLIALLVASSKKTMRLFER